MLLIASFLISRESLQQHNDLLRETAVNLYDIWSLQADRKHDLLSTYFIINKLI